MSDGFADLLGRFLAALRQRGGQGTVEYLGLVLAVGALLLAVSVHVKGGGDGIGGEISKSMERAIKSVTAP